MLPNSPESTHYLLTALVSEFSLTPVMAAEIECYVLLPDPSKETAETFWAPVNDMLRQSNVPLLRIEKERGDYQFEVVTSITTPDFLAMSLDIIKQAIEYQASQMGVYCTFAGKPFSDQPSSGLHLHLHLNDADGNNAFHKPEEWTSDNMRFTISGLLNTLQESMPIFFPNPEDYFRLEDVDHVPKSASWGANNRYCALRIPMNPDPYHKWIEHRVPCANAEPRSAINAILRGVLRGLRERVEPPEQEYGKPTVGLVKSLLPNASGGEAA